MMDSSDLKKKLLAETKLELLERGKVSSWEWYSESLRDADDSISDEDKLNLLENGGVDNWTWYDQSLGEFSSYRDYVESTKFENIESYDQWLESENAADDSSESLPEENPEVDSEITAEPSRELTDSEKAIIAEIEKNTLYTGELDSTQILENLIEAGVWKRNKFPTEFEKSMKFAKKDIDSKIFLNTARNKYIELISKNGKLGNMITELLKNF